MIGGGLYLILFLHQTTTAPVQQPPMQKLYLILFLHQTTTLSLLNITLSLLYLILFLHQTTTVDKCQNDNDGCILFFFYIKPQQV